MTISTQNERARERRVRQLLAEDGYALGSGSYHPYLDPSDYGGYMIVKEDTQMIEVGRRCALSLEDVERWAADIG